MKWMFSAQQCRLSSRFSVRSAKWAILTAAIVAVLACAQEAPAQIVQIRISSSLKTCFIADVAVSCSDVGAKLHAMKVSTDRDIHIAGDTDVTYELVRAATESRHQAGYRTKVGVLTH
jgi:biopolymer transport protein ExbD